MRYSLIVDIITLMSNDDLKRLGVTHLGNRVTLRDMSKDMNKVDTIALSLAKHYPVYSTMVELKKLERAVVGY